MFTLFTINDDVTGGPRQLTNQRVVLPQPILGARDIQALENDTPAYGGLTEMDRYMSANDGSSQQRQLEARECSNALRSFVTYHMAYDFYGHGHFT